MYLGIDIGGTKTLVATLTDDGEIVERLKFPTPTDYPEFLRQLHTTIEQLETKDFVAAGIAAPGRIDRVTGTVLRLGNLAWENIALKTDVEAFLSCEVFIDNDANLAGLSEAQLHPDQQTVLYVTVSTGIGTGVTYNQRLSEVLLGCEGGHMVLPFNGGLKKWESFASGRAIYQHFNKKAIDIPASDTESWGYVAHNLSLGFFEMITLIQPDLIIIGGSIGTYYDRYAALLETELHAFEAPVTKQPKIVQAQRPEEAVVYGCYDLAKQAITDANIAL